MFNSNKLQPVCPLCEQQFTYVNKSAVCPDKHTYDFARQGYLNLYKKKHEDLYTDELFQSRRIVVESGFFDPAMHAIAADIQEYWQQETINIIDYGTGEGSLFERMYQRIANVYTVNAFGVDISKEAIIQATSLEGNIGWLVGDLNQHIFPKVSADFITNILSPASYGNFQRMLKNHGRIYKVIPGEDHLVEIRALLSKPPYDNSEVQSLFASNFQMHSTIDLKHEFNRSPDVMRRVFQMTPLTEHARLAQGERLSEITRHFKLLIGTNTTH